MSKKDLKSMTIRDLIEEDQDFQLISAKESQTLLEVWDLLAKSNVSSVPVVSEKTNEVLGGIDVVDIMSFVSKTFRGFGEKPPTEQQLQEFSSKSVGELLNLSGRNPWNDLFYKSSMKKVLELLSHHSVHRVAVTNEEIDTVGLITQSRLVRFFFDHKDQFSHLMDKTVEQLFEKKNVLSIGYKHFVLEAFELMQKQRVTGLAVVDENEQLVGSISASDLKLFDYKQLQQLQADLHSQIGIFKNIRPSNERLFGSLPKFDPIQVFASDKLEKVIKQIVEHHIHRIFVVDDQLKLINVISLCDIIGLPWVEWN